METAQNQQLLRQPEVDSSYMNQSSYTDKLKVLKIQRTCVHDGPGIRTTIFFQGCGIALLMVPESGSAVIPSRHDA